MRRSIIAALCHLEWVTKEKGSNAETLTGVQDCFTTKGKKSTWGVQYPVLFTTPPAVTLELIRRRVFAPASILRELRALRALRGE